MKSNFHSESGPGTYKKTLKCMSYENHKAFFKYFLFNKGNS